MTINHLHSIKCNDKELNANKRHHSLGCNEFTYVINIYLTATCKSNFRELKDHK